MISILYVYRDKPYNPAYLDKIFRENLCVLDFGFFLISLKTFANLKCINLSSLETFLKKYEFDHIIFDAKLKIDYDLNNFFPAIKNLINCKVSIFLGYDRLFNFNDILIFEKTFNIENYFIPNLLIDISQYNFPDELNKKFIETYFGIGFLNVQYDLEKNIFLLNKNNLPIVNSIFYSGTNTKSRQYRNLVLNYLENGLDIKDSKIITYNDKSIKKKLSIQEYIDCSKMSTINLVLSGNQNNIPYRLIEMGVYNCFFIIDHHFQKYQLSKQYDDLNSYTFSNLESIETKIKTLLNEKDFLKVLKTKQINSFNNFYSPLKHGKFLKNFLV